jgi:hypothetical protein
MTTHNSVAKSVRLRKEQEPDKYCSNPKCLYRTDEAFCPKHMKTYHPVKLCDINGQNFTSIDYSLVGEKVSNIL